MCSRDTRLSARIVAAIAAFALALGACAQAAAITVSGDFATRSVQPDAERNVDDKFIYMFQPTARWTHTVHWKYNHANAPQALASFKSNVIAQLQASFNKWTAQCAVTYQYDGETSTAPGTVVNGQPDGANVVGWGPLDASLKGWTYDWWDDSGNGRTLVDADMTLNPANLTTMSDLDRIATHEWGHAIGLNHSDDGTAIMAGPPTTAYNDLANPQPDDLRGCRCLYGVPSGVQAGYACSLPHQVDFGNQSVGSSSAAQTVTFTNSGNAALQIQSVTLQDAQFTRVSGCDSSTSLPPGASCTMQLTYTPRATGQTSAPLQVYTSDGFYYVVLIGNGTAAPLAQQPATVDVVEYYNASLDHYFITYVAAEMANLDAGLTPTRWTRTGYTFKAYVSPQSGTSPVCRFYIPPQDGSSHWFGRSAAECAAAQQAHPEFVLEDANFMQMYQPVGGSCPSGTTPVYRVFDNRTDVNHRYTTDRAVRDQMVAKGWIAEGDGADRVVMCAPQ